MGCSFCLRGCFHPFRRGVTMNDKKSDPLVEVLSFAIKQFLAWIGEKQRGVKRGRAPLQNMWRGKKAAGRFCKAFCYAREHYFALQKSF